MGESLKRDSLWMMAGQGGGALLQAVYFVLIGRSLGSAQYGAFIGVVAMVGIASQLGGLGMEMTLLRDVSRDGGRLGASWGRAVQVTVAGAVALLLLAVTAGHAWLGRSLWLLLPYVVISDGLFGRLLQVAIRAFQATGEMRWAAALPVTMSGLRAAVAGVFFWRVHAGLMTATAVAWVRMYWVATALAAVVAVVAVTVRLGWPEWRRVRRRELLDGLSFAFSNSSISVYNDVDKSLLAGAGLMESAGIYGAAYRVVDVATMPVYSLFAAATPRYFRAEGVDGTRALMRRVLLRALPLTVAICAGLYLLAGLVPVVIGASFAAAATALRWLCVIPVLRLLHYTWGTAITARMSQWKRTAAQAVAAGLNVGLCLWWIPRWQWRGAAAASVLTDGALVLMSAGIWWAWARRHARGSEEVGEDTEGIGRAMPGWVQ
ncbi:MAG: lipopolysaccharide biosynthesis protein [Acidobacteriaceae bacterium]